MQITPGQQNTPSKRCETNHEPQTSQKMPGRICRGKNQGILQPRSLPQRTETCGHPGLCPPGQKRRWQEPPCPRPGFRRGSKRVPNLHERQPKIVGVVNVMLTGVRSREIPASLLSPPHPSACAHAGTNEASPALSRLLQPEGRLRAPRLPPASCPRPAARTPPPVPPRGLPGASAARPLPDPRATFVYFRHLPCSVGMRC